MERLRKTLARDWQLHVFMLLPLAYVLLFHYVPLWGVQIAFRKYTVRGGITGSAWVGFYQFGKFFASYQFRRVILNTLSLSAYSILCSFPIPILFALTICSLPSKRFRAVAQTVVNMPHFISVVVLVGMLLQIFASRTGIYGIVMERLTGQYPADIFANASNFRHLYIWSGVWQQFGWNAILYIAALSGVSMELHEAAQIDGATRLQRVAHVDFPAILPTVSIMLILRMGSVMTIGFEKVYLMQNDLNLAASEIISTYVYKVGLTGTSDFSYATALGLFNSVVNFLLVLGANRIAKRLGGSGLW